MKIKNRPTLWNLMRRLPWVKQEDRQLRLNLSLFIKKMLDEDASDLQRLDDVYPDQREMGEVAKRIYLDNFAGQPRAWALAVCSALIRAIIDERDPVIDEIRSVACHAGILSLLPDCNFGPERPFRAPLEFAQFAVAAIYVSCALMGVEIPTLIRTHEDQGEEPHAVSTGPTVLH